MRETRGARGGDDSSGKTQGLALLRVRLLRLIYLLARVCHRLCILAVYSDRLVRQVRSSLLVDHSYPFWVLVRGILKARHRSSRVGTSASRYPKKRPHDSCGLKDPTAGGLLCETP